MDEVERLIVRQIAVKMKERQRSGHVASIGRSRRRKSSRGNAGSALHKKNKKTAARLGAGCRVVARALTVMPALARLVLTGLLLARLVLAALLRLTWLSLPALLLLAGLVLPRLRIVLLLLVALRIVVFIRHGTFSSHFQVGGIDPG
jgi:hypothetical protein